MTLTARHRVSRRGISELARDLFGVTLSTGAADAICQHASEALAGPHLQLQDWVLDQSAVHVDETGWRTRVTKGAGSKTAALAMAYKLLESAQERWRRFNGHELVTDVLAGVRFQDGIKVTDDDTNDDNEMTPERVAA